MSFFTTGRPFPIGGWTGRSRTSPSDHLGEMAEASGRGCVAGELSPLDRETLRGGRRFLTVASRRLGVLPRLGRLHDQDLAQAPAGAVQPREDGAARRAHDLAGLGA